MSWISISKHVGSKSPCSEPLFHCVVNYIISGLRTCEWPNIRQLSKLQFTILSHHHQKWLLLSSIWSSRVIAFWLQNCSNKSYRLWMSWIGKFLFIVQHLLKKNKVYTTPTHTDITLQGLKFTFRSSKVLKDVQILSIYGLVNIFYTNLIIITKYYVYIKINFT